MKSTSRRGTVPLQLVIVITILLLSVLPRIALKKHPKPQVQKPIPVKKVPQSFVNDTSNYAE